MYLVAVGYTNQDVVYEWRFGDKRAVVASRDMALSQFDLKDMPAASSTACFKGSKWPREVARGSKWLREVIG